MTSRLKRKLDNMGVDTSNVTQNFCMIGTPLPSLDKADKNEFVPVWKQDVRDEKGRRRLHGAFTGGFSAGYFNTVGSKEGWTPSTFVSSRSNRANKNVVQRPEDFMDEEDLAELRADQKLVDTSQAEGAAGPSTAAPSDDAMAGIWSALVPSVRDSPGAKLLQKMGWRPGQGIGPRITYAKRRAQDRQAGISAGEDEEMDEEARKHLYAPRDTQTLTYRAKDNSFGLGYTPGAGLRDDAAGQKKKDEGPVISAGFGLGALNDADEDDLDVYSGIQAPVDKRRLAFADDEDEDRVLLDSRQASGFRRSTQGPSKPAQGQYYFADGRPVLPGFKPAEAPVVEDVWFPPPEVPEDWQPDPTRVWEANGSVKGLVPPPTVGKDGRPTALRAEERGAMLGETPLAPRSVFDYLSKEAKERLQKATAAVKPPPVEIKREPSPPPEVKMEIPPLEPATAAAALRGFQPFTADPVKQRRYTAYLQMQASRSELPAELSPMPGQSMDAFNKELEDYAKAARIFKPATGAMASRFTSSTTIEQEAKPKEGLHAPEEGDFLEPKAEEENKKLELKETPKQHAAKMGMYGPLTREVSVWAPAKLLCKRFGVRDPYPGGVPADEMQASASRQTAPDASASSSEPLAIAAGPSASTQDKENVPATKKDISNVGLGDDDDQGKDILTYEKPGMDIFKAIFASDDEESDEEDEPAPPMPAPKAATPSTPLKPLENQDVVPHLTAESSIAPVYTPSEGGTAMNLDLSTFKPTFVRKSDMKKDEDDEKGSKKDKKDKKKKDKQLLVSFDPEEGITIKPSREEEKSKKRKRDDKERSKDKDREKEKEERRKKRKAEEEDEEGMWVEKPPPEVVVSSTQPKDEEPSLTSGRKRAVDFF